MLPMTNALRGGESLVVLVMLLRVLDVVDVVELLKRFVVVA